MRPILFRGYFGHGNWGDEILLRALIAGLTSNGVPATKMHYWRGGSQSYQPADINHSMPRGWRGITAWAKAGAMIFSGGILYDHMPKFGSRRLRLIHNLVRITRASGKKAIMFGVSVGPLITPEGRKLTRKILQMADGIWVRDQQSFQFCRESGVPCQQMPDLSTVLTSSIAAIPTPADRQELLFIPCQTGLTYRAHTNLLGSLKLLARERNLTIRVIPLHAEADTDLAYQLCKQQGVELATETVVDPMQIFTRIKAAQLVVSVRLHGGWAAYLTSRPLLQINYHPKCRGFAETIHLPNECLIDPDAGVVDLGTGVDRWFTSEICDRPIMVPLKVLEKKTMNAFVELTKRLVQ